MDTRPSWSRMALTRRFMTARWRPTPAHKSKGRRDFALRRAHPSLTFSFPAGGKARLRVSSESEV